MATGQFDPQGIWQYGEDDERPLPSDLLNIGMESVSTQFEDVRAALIDLESPPDTGDLQVMASATTTVPEGRTKYSANWANLNDSIWQGVNHRRRSEMVYASGACTRSGTALALETIFILPVGSRPATTKPGMAWTSSGAAYVLCRPNGHVQCAVSVSGQLTFALAFIAAAV